MADEPTLTPALEEVTGAQLVSAGTGELARPASLPKTYATYRTMRLHPTIALARAFSSAPVIAGSWLIESDDDIDDELVQFIQKQLFPIREQLLTTALSGQIDFGWQGWEKIFEEKDGRIVLKKAKPLLQDITKIIVDPATGAFIGFQQTDASGKDFILPIDNSLLISARVEGTQWHGQSLMENARKWYNRHTEADAVAANYDRKVAGANVIVHYPVGESKDASGNMTDNGELAKTILAAMEGTGGVIIPNVLHKHIEKLNKEAKENVGWRIEILSDGVPKEYAFVPRLQYLDKLIVRAFLLPERAVLEAQFGTKADAGVHAGLALTVMELIHLDITRHINWYVVDQLLAINWGDEFRSTVRLVVAPLSDEKLSYLREIYKSILANQTLALEEGPLIDTDAMKEAVGVPKSLEVADSFSPGDGSADDVLKEVRNDAAA